MLRSRICFVFFFFSLSSARSDCPRSFIRNNKRVCVELMEERTSWFRAKRRCISKGEKLVELYSQEEDTALADLYSGLEQVWVGGENHADQNLWVWASQSTIIDCELLGRKTGLDSLCEGSETDSSLKCLAFNSRESSRGSSWGIRDCELEKYYFCQREEELEDGQGQTQLRLMSSQGYVELKSKILDHDSLHVIEITLKFSTYNDNGLLLWQGDRDGSSNNFLAVAIKEGFVTVNLGLTELRITDLLVADGEVHQLRLLKTQNNVSLTVDSQYRASSLYTPLDNRLMARQPVFLGGHSQPPGLYPIGFQGCIHHFGIENLCGETAEDCTQFGQSPLDFSSRSHSHLVRDLYSAVSLEVCQLEARPTRPPTAGLSLDGSSFAEMKSQLFSRQPGVASLSVSILVSTKDPDGLLISLGSVRSGDHLVLELQSGRPTVSWVLAGRAGGQIGGKNSRVDTGLPVNITLGLTDDQIYLTSPSQEDQRYGNFALLPSAPVYVGGNPEHPDNLEGCIHSLTVTTGLNTRMIDFTRDSLVLNARTDDRNCRVQPNPITTTTSTTTTTTTTTPTTTVRPTRPSRPPSYGLSSVGAGYAELWDQGMFSYQNGITMMILLTTLSPSGLIFLQTAGSWDNSLLAIGIHQGYPYVDFDFGSGNIKSVSSRVRVDDGVPSLLTITVQPGPGGNVSLEVRGDLSSRSVSGDLAMPPSNNIYLTGLPVGQRLRQGKYRFSLSGCISTFLVQAGPRTEYVDFSQQAVLYDDDSGLTVTDPQCRATPQTITTPPTPLPTPTTLRPDNLGLSLSGDGYAELRSQTKLSLSSGFNISMLVERSSQRSSQGLLLWMGEFDQFLNGHYLSIALKDSDRGQLAVVDWKFGEDRSRIKLLTEQTDSPIYISLRLTGRKVFFTVDSLTESKPMKGSTMPSPPFYVGGVPDLKKTGGRHQSNFQGCIHSIKLDENLLSFADDFDLFNIDNDQSCRIEKFVSRQPPTTTPTTTTTRRTTTVRSPMPARMRCEDDQKLILNGQGYFELKSRVVTYKANSEFDIEIGFSSYSSDGILLQKKSKFTKDSITIEMVDGKIKFQMFYGKYKEGVEIISDEKYNDGEDHVIKAKKLDNGRGSLQVDSTDSKEASAALGGRLDLLDTSLAPAYIGGSPGESRNIVGCVSHLGFWNRPEGRNLYGTSKLSQLGVIVGYGGSTCASQCSTETKMRSPTTTKSIFDFLG